MDGASDGRPRSRAGTARARRKPAMDNTESLALHGLDHHDEFDDNDQSELNIRVKMHGDDDPPPIARRGRIGGLFKETPSTGIKNLFESAPADNLKESIKRPLSGLFRRPASRSGGRTKREDETDEAPAAVAAGSEVRSISPEMKNFTRDQNSVLPSSLRGDYDALPTAPHLTASELHGLLQVDALAAKHPNLVKLDDLDISLLSRFVYMEEETRDESVPWTWDYLFASVSSEMREEWANEEEMDDEYRMGYAR